jgi:hypothetical protein
MTAQPTARATGAASLCAATSSEAVLQTAPAGWPLGEPHRARVHEVPAVLTAPALVGLGRAGRIGVSECLRHG